MTKQLSNLFTTFEHDMGIVCDGRDLKPQGAHYKCTWLAVNILVVHQIDECDASSVRWTATPKGKGDRVFLLCAACSSETCRQIDDMLARMKKALPPPASWLECTSCGKRIKRLSDICSVKPLLNV